MFRHSRYWMGVQLQPRHPLRAKRRIRSARLYRGSAAPQRNALAVRSLAWLRSALLDPARLDSVGLGLDMGRGDLHDVQHQSLYNSAEIFRLKQFQLEPRRIYVQQQERVETNIIAGSLRFLSRVYKWGTSSRNDQRHRTVVTKNTTLSWFTFQIPGLYIAVTSYFDRNLFPSRPIDNDACQPDISIKSSYHRLNVLPLSNIVIIHAHHLYKYN